MVILHLLDLFHQTSILSLQATLLLALDLQLLDEILNDNLLLVLTFLVGVSFLSHLLELSTLSFYLFFHLIFLFFQDLYLLDSIDQFVLNLPILLAKFQ